VFGHRRFANTGFHIAAATLPAGTYSIAVYAHSTVTGTFNIERVVDVTIRDGEPLMALDTPGSGATLTLPFVVGGWAVDRAATKGTGVDAVHVWAYPLGGGAPLWVGAHYGSTRPDVAAAFGETRFTHSGYHVVCANLPPGPYRLVVSAHSTVTGAFNNARVADLTVVNGVP